jgi:hypothetical protein
MSFEHFTKSIASPGLRAVVSHWEAVRSAGQMPSWEHLRPSQLSAHLSFIWAFKYDRNTGQFTGRLAGNRITQGFGKNFRGLPLQDLHPPDVFPRVLRTMTRIVAEPAAFRSAGPLFKHEDRIFEGERIILPLAGDGVHGDGVLGASDYVYQHPVPGRIELLSGIEEWCPVASVTSGPQPGPSA